VFVSGYGQLDSGYGIALFSRFFGNIFAIGGRKINERTEKEESIESDRYSGFVRYCSCGGGIGIASVA
jgi:hypothetical protein